MPPGSRRNRLLIDIVAKASRVALPTTCHVSLPEHSLGSRASPNENASSRVSLARVDIRPQASAALNPIYPFSAQRMQNKPKRKPRDRVQDKALKPDTSHEQPQHDRHNHVIVASCQHRLIETSATGRNRCLGQCQRPAVSDAVIIPLPET